MTTKNPTTRKKSNKKAGNKKAAPPENDHRIVMGIRWHPDNYKKIEQFQLKHRLRSMNLVVRIGTKLLVGIKDEETKLLDQ